MQIGELDQTEIDAAVDLWRTCGLTRPWNDPHADIRLALDAAASTLFAGRVGGQLVATAMTGFEGHRAWVYYLAVDPSYRGAGHGRALMRACEVWAAGQGAPKIQLMVRTDNEAASAFYQTLGYQRQDVEVYGRRLDAG